MGTRNLLEILTSGRHVFKKSLSERLICEMVDCAIHSDRYEHAPLYLDVKVERYQDFNQLKPHVLAEILEGLAMSDPKQVARNKRQFSEKVASLDLIAGDYAYTSTVLMDGFSGKNREDFDLMATLGHAQNGHGLFKGHGKYPNTTFDVVMDALCNNSKKLANQEILTFPLRCQEDVDEYTETMVFSFFEGENYRNGHKKLLNAEGKPLGRLNFLNGFKAYSLSLLTGWVFTGSMDSEEIRDEVEKKYGHRMGRGETYAVDRSRLASLGINLDELAKKEYSYKFIDQLEPPRMIQTFREAGIIVSEPVSQERLDPEMTWSEAKETFGIRTSWTGGDIIQAYIRSVKGMGVADDIAIFLSGYLVPSYKNLYRMVDGTFVPYYNNNPSELMSQLLGGSGADRVDTKEKYSQLIVEGGQDSLSARLAQEKFSWICNDPRFRNLYDIPKRNDEDYAVLDRDTIIDFTLASAKLKYDIHSSARYFLKAHEIENKIRKNVNGGELTCTTNEIFRLAAEIAKYLHIPCDSLYKGNGSVPCDMTVGFHKIPLDIVLAEMRERLGVVIDPVKRYERLHTMSADFRVRASGYKN